MTRRKTMFVLFTAMVLAVFTLPTIYAAQRKQVAVAQSPEDAKQFVVMIKGAIGQVPTVGAGIIIGAANDRLYIATANHVVREGNSEAKDLQVQLKWLPGEWVAARLLQHRADDLDLAVINVPDAAKLGGPAFAWDVLAKPDTVTRGTKVFPIGYPGGKDWYLAVQPAQIATKSTSVISAESTIFTNGHSGGALVTEQGDIVGLVTSTSNDSGQSVPIDRVVDQFREWSYPIALTWKSARVAPPDEAPPPRAAGSAAPASAGTAPPGPVARPRPIPPALVRELGAAMGGVNGTPVPGQWYRLQAKHSQKYLDVQWGSRDEHAPIVQAGLSDWENGAAQLWTLVPDRDGLYRLRVKHSGKYLDVTWGSTENAAKVAQSGLSDWSGGAAQLWRLIPQGDGWFKLQVEHSRKYLDVLWGSREDHAAVGQAGASDWEGGAAQMWRFIPG